jgi:hypothetical protein
MLSATVTQPSLSVSFATAAAKRKKLQMIGIEVFRPTSQESDDVSRDYS